MKFKTGDVVIRKLKHSCDIRIVEDSSEHAVLLVNGVRDAFYEFDDIDILYEKYELLVKYEDRMDSFA